MAGRAPRRRGYVVAGADWHEGVIGIVASRLVERFGRPVVLIAGADGSWKGSGRAPGAFDLHGALAACAEHLERFGGHRAAAGLTIRPERGRGVRGRRSRAHADAVLTDEDLRPRHRGRRDRRAAPSSGCRSARSSRGWRPFGLGNPGVTLLDRRLRADRARHRRRGEAPPLPRPPARPRRGLGDRVRERRAGSTASAASAATTSPSGSRRTAGTARSRRSSSCGGSSTRPSATRSCARWLAEQWRGGEAGWTPEARAIFAELELTEASPQAGACSSRSVPASAGRGRAYAARGSLTRLRRRGGAAASSSRSRRATRRSFLACRRRRNMGRRGSSAAGVLLHDPQAEDRAVETAGVHSAHGGSSSDITTSSTS